MAVTVMVIGASVLIAAIPLRKLLQTSTPSGVSERSRYLLITIVNQSDCHRLNVEDSWFQCGAFWPPLPFGDIPPRSSITLFACNTDLAMFTGVSGGIGLHVYENDSSQLFTSDEKEWWICTFSSPYVGSKRCLTQWKDHGVFPLWEKMQKAHHVADALCGCYQKDANHMVFTWKGAASNRSSPWLIFLQHQSVRVCNKAILRCVLELKEKLGEYLMDVLRWKWKLAVYMYNEVLLIKPVLSAYINELRDGCEGIFL